VSGCKWFSNCVCLDCDHAFRSGAVAICPACGRSRLARVSVRYTSCEGPVSPYSWEKVLRAILAARRGRSRPKPEKPRAPSARERWAAKEAGR